MREYSRLDTVIANIPYTAMVLLGAAIIALAYAFSPFGLASAGLYLAYGVAGAFWIMFFVCPYCAFFDTKACPCGYGMIAARIAKKGARENFAEKFKKHIPVIVPLWILPVLYAAIGLWQSFSWLLAILVAAFVIEAWIILPMVSKKHCCAECPQKEQCPWMGTGGSCARDAQ
ncbi:hypothetical protein JXA32_10090 [Candidatus Sumerlaeota bacterium]|nr:hypothetical protein [Candidatus Sumerlaeota bacterium]